MLKINFCIFIDLGYKADAIDNVVLWTIVSSFRLDCLYTDFITWRGMLTKIMCSLYDRTPWKMAAVKYNGTIYFRELDTEENIKRKESATERDKRMCYWGIKFEDYMTSASMYRDV